MRNFKFYWSQLGILPICGVNNDEWAFHFKIEEGRSDCQINVGCKLPNIERSCIVTFFETYSNLLSIWISQKLVIFEANNLDILSADWFQHFWAFVELIKWVMPFLFCHYWLATILEGINLIKISILKIPKNLNKNKDVSFGEYVNIWVEKELSFVQLLHLFHLVRFQVDDIHLLFLDEIDNSHCGFIDHRDGFYGRGQLWLV